MHIVFNEDKAFHLAKLMDNALATSENLFYGICSSSPIFPIGSIEVELIEHILFRRNWAV